MAVLEQDIAAPVSAGGRVAQETIGARRLGLWLAIGGWASMAAMWLTQSSELFGHEQEGIAGIGLFLVGWTVMVAGMMLPSSLPTLGLVDRTAGPDTDAPRIMLGFFLPWAIFGAAAFAGDGILHLAADNMPWLAQRPSLIAGGVAVFAGVAEFLGRTPPPRLPKIGPGAGSFALGRAHAIDRIRRCWPLMLFAMAVGMSSPTWMVVLTLIMALELRPRASTALRLVGLTVFGLGVAVVIEPGWLVLIGS
jgi:predicted metal-binding membrane protein